MSACHNWESAGVLVCFSVTVIAAWPKQFGEEGVYFVLKVYSPSLREANWKWKKKTIEEWNACCLSSRLVFSYRSYIVQAHLPRCGTVHSGLGYSASISNQENDPWTCSQDNLGRGEFLSWISLFQVDNHARPSPLESISIEYNCLYQVCMGVYLWNIIIIFNWYR